MGGSAPFSLNIVDAGRGMAAALVARMMADLGARVVRVEPEGGDPFHDVYPAYDAWHDGSDRASPADLSRLLPAADVLIVGGEEFPDTDWVDVDATILAACPRLVVLRLGGMLSRDGAGVVPTVDLLIQAATGFVNEQFTDRPIHFSFGGPSYGSAIAGLIGIWSALIERQRSGLGQTVSATMEQGLALFWPQIWITARDTTEAFENFSPRDVRHLIFRTADDLYVHFTMGVPGAVAKLYGVLGIDEDVDPADRGGVSMARGIRNFFGNRDLIEPAVRRWKRDDLLQAIWDVGMAVEAVKAPGDCVNDEQIAANDFLRSRRNGERVVASPLSRVGVIGERGNAATLGALPAVDVSRPVLDGLRVVDLGNFVAGPYASRLLAELGADVIKVEPLSGQNHVSGLRNVWACNRGKRSICLDAKRPEGADILRKIISTADVSQHNFRLGVAPRLGVDPASLRAINPDIVTLETTAYGARGPKAPLPGFDMGMQALTGHEVRAGGRGNIPLWYRSPFLDYGTGGLGAVAMLAGTYIRNETGCAVELGNSLLASGLYFLSEMVIAADGRIDGVPALNGDMTGFNAWERLYRTADGWIAVAARGDAMARRLADCLSLGGQLGDRRDWDDNAGEVIAAAFVALSTRQALGNLAAADVWAVRCSDDAWPRLREDAVARDSGLVVEVPDPCYGAVTAVGRIVELSRSLAAQCASAPPYAPLPGEHTREILSELGYTADAVERLYADRIVA